MKNWNWKQWTAFSLIIVVIITMIVLHFIQPVISYAFAEAMVIGGFILGICVGYMIKSKKL